MTTRVVEGEDVYETSISPALTFLLATACGLIAANLYYGQPLAGIIGAELGLSAGATGLIVTLTQIGYGVGLLFVVPLGDLVENRRLVVSTVSMAVLALLAAAFAPHAAPFLIAAFLVGISSVAVQVIVPYAAHMAPARCSRAGGRQCHERIDGRYYAGAPGFQHPVGSGLLARCVPDFGWRHGNSRHCALSPFARSCA
ncbi:MFS family permease [Agrobacterium tumefaciens]|nr:MFS family permease [Agrobacterium tumefaciens]